MLSSLDGLKGLQNIYKITNNSMLKTGIPDMLLLGMFRNINDTVKSNESEWSQYDRIEDSHIEGRMRF